MGRAGRLGVMGAMVALFDELTARKVSVQRPVDLLMMISGTIGSGRCQRFDILYVVGLYSRHHTENRGRCNLIEIAHGRTSNRYQL